MNSTGRRRRLAWFVGTAMMAAALAPVPSAAAEAVAVSTEDFYDPPAELGEDRPGDVIRSGPTRLAVSVPTGRGPWPAKATRLMYRSTGVHGEPIAVTGLYLDPTEPWRGDGPRPLITFGVGTHGQGDQCAPSKLFAEGLHYEPPLDIMPEYEILYVYEALSRGIAVVISDYQGLGTPGTHLYYDRRSQAHTLLDAARAARNLRHTKLDHDPPVGIAGYSQGGGAAGAAAELQAAYAPDLKVRGATVGAPPLADPRAGMAQIDKTIAAGTIGYMLNGFAEAYPDVRDDIDRALNARGKTVLRETAHECLAETVLRHSMESTRMWTRTYRPLTDVLDRYPDLAKRVDQQGLGRFTPRAPVLLIHNINDDVVPYGPTRRLAATWCAHGADVALDTEHYPPILPGSGIGHGRALGSAVEASLDWLSERFDGRPVSGGCARK